MLNWNELVVSDADGDVWGTLGDLVSNAPANLDNAIIGTDGTIQEWEGFFLSEDGQSAVDDNGLETLDRNNVNWDGLRDALNYDSDTD